MICRGWQIVCVFSFHCSFQPFIFFSDLRRMGHGLLCQHLLWPESVPYSGCPTLAQSCLGRKALFHVHTFVTSYKALLTVLGNNFSNTVSTSDSNPIECFINMKNCPLCHHTCDLLPLFQAQHIQRTSPAPPAMLL